jgi:RimJ/RimL family protein N-acetyltransferase
MKTSLILQNAFGASADGVEDGIRLGDQLDSLQLAELAGMLSDVGLAVHDLILPECTPIDIDNHLATLPERGRLARSDGDRHSAQVGNPPLRRLGADRVIHPPLHTANTRLRVILPDAMPYLYSLATDETVGHRWRFRGSVPTLEKFQSTFWQGTLAQFIVTMSSGEPIGHVVCYGHEANSQFAFAGMVFSPPVLGTGLPIEAGSCFLYYLFRTWNLRKIYFELPQFNYPQLASGLGRFFHEEGRLLAHEFYAGRYWDKIYLAVYRDEILGSLERKVFADTRAESPGENS